MKKNTKVLFVLLVVLVASILIFRACSQSQNDDLSSYDSVVTYVVNFAQTEEEPMSIQLGVSPNGTAYIPSEIEGVDDYIWTGWLTEDGAQFDFNTIVKEDITLTGTYYPDVNHNGIVDGTTDDPMVVYQFVHANGVVMQTESFFGTDYEFDYSDSIYDYPSSEDDSQIFLGWIENWSESEDGGLLTCVLTPDLAVDINNNDLVDGSAEDPYVYYIFLMEDGSTLLELRRLTTDSEVKVDSVTYPAVSKENFLGWDETASVNEDGCTVHTYTPVIVVDETAAD